MSADSSSSESPLKSSAEKLKRELDHWLEVAMAQGERALDAFGIRPGLKHWIPNADVVDTADQIKVFVDLPGVAADSIQVALTGNMLTFQGERAAHSLQEGDSLHVNERPSGRFQRSLPLPVSVDSDKVVAEAKDGVLLITIAKSERAKAKQIQVIVDT